MQDELIDRRTGEAVSVFDAIDWEYADYVAENAELAAKSEKKYQEWKSRQPVRTARLHSKCDVSVSDESFVL